MISIFQAETIAQGGPIVLILIGCSIISVALILERMYYLKPKKIICLKDLQAIESEIERGDLKKALAFSRSNNSPMMKVAEVAILNADKPKADLKMIIEESGRLEVPRLEHYLSTLHTIAVVSPLLGLLGTVLGMIHVFDAIVTQGTGNNQLLAGGISEAMITTAFGLMVAIPTLVFTNYFTKKVDLILVEMERHSLYLYEMLTAK
ncbi:MAG: MotA/TolQ/ExbB proton channel family protein [SAR324 cluster bacterium]|nr:MotA/TolQ/ExbB proton channel family protein [SAR324 cluster bacterium]